jgi:hypothetical protein
MSLGQLGSPKVASSSADSEGVNRFRRFWQAWSADERYYKIRRFDFAFGTPLLLIATIVFLVLHAWTVAAVAAVTMMVGIVGILRTPWPRDEPGFRSLMRRWFG